MNKQKSHAFGKDVYLLGTIDGRYQWLEAPSWDCGWYWGFGYVEEYTSHMYPENSRDISCHQHMSGLLVHGYDWEKWDDTVLSDKERWEIAELFKQFYLLKDMAEFSKNGKSNISSTTVKHGDMGPLQREINEEMIPRITNRIIEILTPEGSDE